MNTSLDQYRYAHIKVKTHINVVMEVKVEGCE